MTKGLPMSDRSISRQSTERGAVAGEYAVLLAILSIALVTVIGLFTDGLVRAFDAAIAVLP